MAQPGQEGPAEPRVALLTRLIRATHATEMTVRVIETIMVGVANAVNASLDLAPADAEALYSASAELEASRPQIEDRILARLLFTYRVVPDEDLASYVAFWESDLGQWFNRVSSDAYLEALQGASARVTQGVG